jgi:hypothetical protein
MWADEIEALWDDEERQDELGRLGLARSQQFSWLRAARETLNVYRRAAKREVARPAPLPASRASAPELLGGDDAALALAALTPGAPRTCLRCGAAMQAGELQRGMLVHAPEDGHQHAPRAWACPRCGYVELVIDWAVPAGAPAELAPDEALAAQNGAHPLEVEVPQAVEPAPQAAMDAGELPEAPEAPVQAAPAAGVADADDLADVELATDSQEAGLEAQPGAELAADEASELVAPEDVPESAPLEATLADPGAVPDDQPALAEAEAGAAHDSIASADVVEEGVRAQSNLPQLEVPTLEVGADTWREGAAEPHATNGAAASHPRKSRQRQEQRPADSAAPTKRRQSRSKRKQAS